MGKEVLDTFFLIHGAPLVLIDDTIPARTFLKSWREKILAQKPTSILVISGHWETNEPSVNVPHRHETIHDFEDFPDEMYQLQYPAPGAPELAKRVNEVLMAGGFKQVHEDKERGLDHGSWVPLMQMYPEANIPVCQLSIQPHKDGTYHYNLGKALAPLREEGVLILGTGSVTHNMDTIRHPNDGSVAPWALEFDTWVKEALLNGRYDDVNHYLERGPHAKMAHPEPEHFYPLLAAIGAAGGEKAKAELIHHSWSRYTISYANYRFTSI